MSDLRFNEVVETAGMQGVQPDRHYRAICKTCDQSVNVYKREWRQPLLVDRAEMKYVAQMRAWNHCHPDEEPADGFPEDPRDL